MGHTECPDCGGLPGLHREGVCPVCLIKRKAAIPTKISVHDIEFEGTNYILEWTHSDDGEGYIAITEACDDPEDDEAEHMHETYDFEEVT